MSNVEAQNPYATHTTTTTASPASPVSSSHRRHDFFVRGLFFDDR
jgi:hypothetical protein